VSRIFKHSNIEDAPNRFAKSYVKFASDLRQEFNRPEATSPEVSCTVSDEKFSLKYLRKIIVDPYVVNGQELTETVKDYLDAPLRYVVSARAYRDRRQDLIQELAELLVHRIVSAPAIANDDNNSEELRHWAAGLVRGDLGWLFDRFARYLRTGTLLELYNED
jgi:hypothetical protein